MTNKVNSQNKLPDGYTWVETLDGSCTLFSESFGEACHSTSGAKQETLLHYIQGCKIHEKLESLSKLTLLEVGFGLGIGFLTTWELLKNSKTPWHYLSLEIDEQILEWFRIENLNHPFLKNLQWIEEENLKRLELCDANNKLTILVGDARQTLPRYLALNPLKWNAIYQDAFSPRKNPVLWTKEWFDLLKTHSEEDVTLSTYSSSSSIRKSLLEAGWILHQGEKFGPKRTSTRATLTGESNPDILLHLARSPIKAITDANVDEFTKVTR